MSRGGFSSERIVEMDLRRMAGINNDGRAGGLPVVSGPCYERGLLIMMGTGQVKCRRV